MNKRHLFSILLLLLTQLSLFAQQKDKTHHIIGELYDSFTKIAIQADLYLMDKDSTIVDSAKTQIYNNRKTCQYHFALPKEEKDYILKAKAPGYEVYYRNLHFKPRSRKFFISTEPIWMKKKNKEYNAELNEVVVKATRVQMYYKGDTIVYDASAFVIPEGSMLDALVRQMPGASMDEYGNISINGKHVDYLTLNGKDFFKGKNKLMLENLPYYTIKDIKVYDKEKDEIEKIANASGTPKDYVMDVNLKREYQHSYLGNTEIGGGTKDRWLGRFFGLYTGELNTMSLYANANNVNEDRKPGQDGSWKPSSMKKSIKTSKQVGFTMQTDAKNKKWINRLEINSEWSKDKMESKSFSETYASDGNITKGSVRNTLDKTYHLDFYNRFYLKKKGALTYQVAYDNNKNWTTNKDSTYRNALVNMSDNLGLSKRKTFDATISLNRQIELPTGDVLAIMVDGNYNVSKPNESFTLNRTWFANSSANDERNQYNDRHSHTYRYTANAQYNYRASARLTINASLKYIQTYKNSTNSNYRLDWLENGNVDEFGVLPSSDVLLMEAFDPTNSNTYNSMKRNYEASLNIGWNCWDKGSLYIGIPGFNMERERMHYKQNSLDTIANRRNIFFQPFVQYRSRGKNSLIFAYGSRSHLPEFSSLMPYQTSNNALAIHINSPNQKAYTEHRFYVNKSWKSDSSDLSRWVDIETRIVRNAFGTQTSYNTKTGAFTYMNSNVNGNWDVNVKTGFTRSLDKKHRLRLDMDASLKYVHSVDFDIAYDSEKERLSHVNTWNPALNFSLRYRFRDFAIGLTGKSLARFSNGDRENFEKIKACDFQYGGNLQYTIPTVKLTLATDINLFSRRGYNNSMMNTDDLVWNAQLTRPFCKGKVIAKLQAFDILHQLSNKNFYVDAQGRTETWYNAIPRYIMFSLAFKMHKKEKK